MDPKNQIHDFNPGIAENGLFWTIPLPESSLDVHFGKGTGSLHVSGLDVEDYHDIVNALQDGPSVEATVSFDIHWLAASRNSKRSVAGCGQSFCRTLRAYSSDHRMGGN